MKRQEAYLFQIEHHLSFHVSGLIVPAPSSSPLWEVDGIVLFLPIRRKVMRFRLHFKFYLMREIQDIIYAGI